MREPSELFSLTSLVLAVATLPFFLSVRLQWFHTGFRADEWMLYELEAPRACGGRALCHGRLYTLDGVLAVSTAQEGVIRLKK